jgi:predicted acetylornithine/succinylornithine family transaminase
VRNAPGLEPTDTTDAPALQLRYELDVYGKRGITLARGRGSRLWDDEGREYIDCMSGHGAFNLGHSDPRLLDALCHQAGKLMAASGAFHHPERARLMKRLVELAPGSLSRAFFCNSGTEAIEAALKFARVATGRTSMVSFKRSFHGRTMGAMSASFQPKYHEMFAPVVPGVRFLPFNDVESLDYGLGDDVACVVLELVQGEGGVHVARPDFVEALARLSSERGILLVVDEVQTAFGRTGALFACEHYRLEPDLLVLAKSIAGGFPMGAVLVGDRIDVPVGAHGSTFGGNPLACAVANRMLDCLLEDAIPERARRLGAPWLDRLRRIPSPLVEEVRGLGLMAGLQLGTKVAPVLEALAHSGVLALAAGPKVLRLLPPLVVDEDDLERVAIAIEDVLSRSPRPVEEEGPLLARSDTRTRGTLP